MRGFLLSLLLWAGAADGRAPSPQATADTVSAAQWGVLAELAERDFEAGMYLISFRWVTPGERLDIIYFTTSGAGGRETTYVHRDPATGTLRWMNVGPLGDAMVAPLRLEPDGAISRALKRDRYERWFEPAVDGRYQMNAIALLPVDPAGKFGQRRARLLAAGRLKPGARATEPPAVAAPAPGAAPAELAWRRADTPGAGDGEVRQTPQGAHRFLATLAEQGQLAVHYHYRHWPAFVLAYRVTGVTEHGECRTMFAGRPHRVQVAGRSPAEAGTPGFATEMKELAERHPHRPLPAIVDWARVTSVGLTGPSAGETSDGQTVLLASGQGETALRVSDHALAKRVQYAMTFLKEYCDKTAETGF